METIALFGGSFDPPHIGHEAIVKAVLELEFIDKVVIMPTYLNPFKHSFCASAALRLQWLKQIFGSNERVVVDSYEVDKAQKVPTIESVEYLLRTYKKIYLVIGADNLASLERWNNYDKLAKLVTFIVASRDDIAIPQGFLRLNVDVQVSSTSLRKKIDPAMLSKQCAIEITQFYKEKNGK